MKKFYALLFSLFIICSAYAQLTEVGRFDDYALHSAIALKDRVFLYKHNGYDKGYYTTADFRTFTRASYPFEESYLGEFVKDGELYFITRKPYVASPQYILRLNEQNGLDTVSTFSASIYQEAEILGMTESLLYFRVSSAHLRFDFVDSSVTRLSGIPSTNLFHTIYAITDTSIMIYASTDNVFGAVNVRSNTFRAAKLNLENYNYPNFFPQMRYKGGFLFTYYDSTANNYGAFFTNGDSVLATHLLPQPADTLWKLAPLFPLKYRVGFEPNYSSFKYNFNQQYIYGERERRLPDLSRTFKMREAWWYFDSISDSFLLIDDSTEFFYPYPSWDEWMLFDLKKGKAGYGHYKNSGLEIIGFEGNQKKLLKDIYPGMASGLLLANNWNGKYYDYVTNNGLLYVTGWHPYFGQCLYRSDGSEQGTGIVGMIGERFSSRAKTRVYPVGNKIFLSLRYDFKNYLYEADAESSFLEPPSSIKVQSFWNKNIYPRIYGNSSGSGGSGIARSSYKSGLILQQTEHKYTDYFAYAEDKKYSPIINKNHPYPASAIAIYDTTGNLVQDYIVQAYRSQATLTYDSTIVLFIRHNDESRTSFDTLLQSGERTYLDKYTLEKQRISRTILPFNFDVYKLETAENGFVYVTGLYEDRELRLNNITLRSQKNDQYFIAAFNNNLQPVWAKNINLPNQYTLSSYTNITDLLVDNVNSILYTVFNEGSVHRDPEDGDHLWQGTIQAFDAITGQELFQTTLQTEGTSVLKSITKTDLNELWIAGTLNKKTIINGEAQKEFGSSTGALLVLDANTGKLKRSYAKPDGNYIEVAAKNNSVYCIWYSREKVLSGNGIASEDRNFSLNFEQRDLSGILQSEYVNPIRNWDRDRPEFDLYPEINDNNDWLLFSVINEYGPLSDSLHFPNVSSTAFDGNTLLMRRPGQIFKELPPQNLAGWKAQEPVAYPNPVINREVFIGSLEKGVRYSSYELIGLDGRVIDFGSINQEQWPIHITFQSGLSGIFFLRLNGPEVSKTFKLIFGIKN